MAQLVINSTPVRETDDPFGLHDPLTMDDLLRIEVALKDGAVSGDEAERLRAIYEAESAKLNAAIGPAVEKLMAPIREVGAKFARELTASIVPERFANIGKLSDSLANMGDTARLLEGLKPLATVSFVDTGNLVRLSEGIARPVDDSELDLFPLEDPVERAVRDQRATLDQIRDGIEQVAHLADAQRLVITELLRQLQAGGDAERRRHRLTVCLTVTGLLIATVLGVINLLKG